MTAGRALCLQGGPPQLAAAGGQQRPTQTAASVPTTSSAVHRLKGYALDTVQAVGKGPSAGSNSGSQGAGQVQESAVVRGQLDSAPENTRKPIANQPHPPVRSQKQASRAAALSGNKPAQIQRPQLKQQDVRKRKVLETAVSSSSGTLGPGYLCPSSAPAAPVLLHR